MTRVAEPNKGRRLATILGAAFLIGYGAWHLYLWWLRSEPLDIAAHKVMRALETGDVDTLWHYSFQREKDVFALDKAEFEQIMLTDATASIKPCTFDRMKKVWSDLGRQYVFTKTYKRGQGLVPVSVTMFPTRDGPRCYLVTKAIFTGFRFRYGERHAEAPLPAMHFRVFYDGLRAELPRIRKLGVSHYIATGTASGKMFEWETMMASYYKGCKYKEGEGPPPPVQALESSGN